MIFLIKQKKLKVILVETYDNVSDKNSKHLSYYAMISDLAIHDTSSGSNCLLF